jgi:hypothetical protein
MILGHVAGMPLEEWLGPIAIGGSGLAVALRGLLRRCLHLR